MTATSLNESVIQTLKQLEEGMDAEKNKLRRDGIRASLDVVRSNLLNFLLSAPPAPPAPPSPPVPRAQALAQQAPQQQQADQETPAQAFERQQAAPHNPAPMAPVRQELPVLWTRALRAGANAVSHLIDQMRAQQNDADAEKLAEVATAWMADGRLKPPVQDVDEIPDSGLRTDSSPGT